MPSIEHLVRQACNLHNFRFQEVAACIKTLARGVYMLTNMKSCSLRLALSLAILLASFATSASAQQRHAFCFNEPSYGSASTSAYFTAVFPIADSLTANQFGQISWNGEPTASFRRYLIDKYGVSATPTEPDGPADANNTVCNVYSTLSAANEEIRIRESYDRTTAHRVVREVSWIYNTAKQGTHTGGAKPTEAEALYDAENWQGPFEDSQYKTIHSWDTHDCTTKQVTGVAGSSKPTTFYQCTVTFSYSDTASPVAKAAFGKGDTQDAAIAAAKSSANTVLLTGITWGQPLCGSFSTTVKNAYKADYGHSAGAKKENWACEVDFTGNK